jgi:hypothetical protein
MAVVVEVADDERRHGRTLTRAHGSTAHKSVPALSGFAQIKLWWAAVDSNHLPPR